MTSKLISIANDFSPSPAGRYIEDGPFPGAVFRDNLLIPAIQQYDKVVINLDGTSGYGSSFLEEAFGGLVRKGLNLKALKEKLTIESTRKSYASRVWAYIEKASTGHE